MNIIFLVFFALAIGASAWGADRDLLTAEPLRITDKAIAADIKVIQGLQGRLADLNNKGVPIASYYFAKAQAWLDFALDEYTINDRSRVVDEALHQALSLIEQLEAGKKEIGKGTPIIPTSSVVRPDLWDKAEDLKKRMSSHCAGDKIAQLEVQLVWAGHENREFGWRHSKPYLQAAERLAREADEQMATCLPEPVASVAAKSDPVLMPVGLAASIAPIAEPAAAPRVETAAATLESAAAEERVAVAAPGLVPFGKAADPAAMLPATSALALPLAQSSRVQKDCPETITGAIIKSFEPLPDRIHFAFDRADISAASASVIERIAAAMRADPTLRIILCGHTDQRGNSYYNMNLSRLRADNVRDCLVRSGILDDRIYVAPLGKLRPLTVEKSFEAYASNRRVEFFFTPRAVPAHDSPAG